MIAEGRPGPSPTAETVHHDSKARDPPLRAPLPVRTGSVKPGPNWMFCAAPPGHLVVPTGETAWGSLPPALPPHGTVLAWARGCRCEQCEREYQRFVSELAWRGPLRLPAQPEPRKLDAGTPRPAGAGGEPVRVPRVRRAAPSAVPQPGVPPAFRADSS